MLPPSLPLTSSNLEVDAAHGISGQLSAQCSDRPSIYIQMASIVVSQIYVFHEFMEISSWATPATLETVICGCLQKITKDLAAAFQVEDECRLACTWKV